MNARHERTMKLFAAAVLCASAAACAAPQPTAGELVERAAATTTALKSATFDLVRVGEPVVLDATSGFRFSAAAGEYQAPDRVRARVKVAALGTVITVDMLWLPEGAYSSNPFTGALERLPTAPGFDPAALVRTEIPNLLRSDLRGVTLVGKEKLGPAEAYHVRAEADGARLRGITGGVVVPGTHTVDMWIDVTSYHLLRLVDAEPGGAASGWRLELSGFDKPVEIKPP